MRPPSVLMGMVLFVACVRAAQQVPAAQRSPEPDAPRRCEALATTLKTSPTEAERAQAARDLGKLGACGVKALGVAIREDESYIVPQAALEALGGLGPLGLEAVPDVIDGSLGRKNMDPLNSDQVMDTLVVIGPGAIPHLVPYLRMDGPTADEDTLRTWGFAARALGRFGEQAVPALIEALAVRDQRSAAVAALGDIGPAAAAAVPALVAAYGATNEPLTKSGIVLSLYRIGDKACAARGFFEKLSQEPADMDSFGERRWAREMVEKLRGCPTVAPSAL
jgi:PBS lyase HEAT-like repeat